ncbi:unnamed protein product [Allacma fusca]|uniref:folate gamma-glutamyl hydrolase n=1 Tax=Allacma fusca TaxID=39272 RepID=A0A8J2PVD4_9HEXA|nr:unnamed protein product [Allacma fusca]
MFWSINKSRGDLNSDKRAFAMTIDETAADADTTGEERSCASTRSTESDGSPNISSSPESPERKVTSSLSSGSMSFYKSKSKPFTWTLSLLVLSVVSMWLCIVFYLLPSQPKNEDLTWTWTEPEDQSSKLNQRPIIGVLTQEYKFYDWHPSSQHHIFANSDKFPKPNGHNLYIAASYIQFIEGAGARAVPILANGDEAYLRKIFKSVNGILFPGGAVPFNDSLYGKAGRLLLQLAREANDRGDYFPMWGTCLGFEFMLYTASGSQEIRADCGAVNVVDRLKFTEAASKSRLFGNAKKSVISALGTKKVTINFHKYCITPENFTKFNLDQEYQILSINYDSTSKLSYVSSVEHKRYPFYAVQFHPEKVLYEWTTKEKIPHSREAIESSQYFANYLIDEAKKNNHTFESQEEENRNLIYNYIPTFTGANGSTFGQTYFFAL